MSGLDLAILSKLNNLKTGDVTSTVSNVIAGETLTAGDVVSLYPNGKLYKSSRLADSLSTSPTANNYGGGHDSASGSIRSKIIGTNKLVTVSKDGSNQLACSVGAINQDTGEVTWGTQTVSSLVATAHYCHHYQTDTDKIIVYYQNGTTAAYMVCIDISTTTPVFGAALTVRTNPGSEDGYQIAVSENTVSGNLLACVVANSTTTSTDNIHGYCVSVNTTTNALTLESGPATIATNTGNLAAKDYQVNYPVSYGAQPEDFTLNRSWVHYSATSNRFVVFYNHQENPGGPFREAYTRQVQMDGTTITLHNENVIIQSNTGGSYPKWGDVFYYDSTVDRYFVTGLGGNFNESFNNEYHIRCLRINGAGVTEVTHSVNLGSSDYEAYIFRDKLNTDEYRLIRFGTSDVQHAFRWDNTGNTFESVDEGIGTSGGVDFYNFYDFGSGEQMYLCRYLTSHIPGFGDTGSTDFLRNAMAYFSTDVANTPSKEDGLNYSTVENLNADDKFMKVELNTNLWFEVEPTGYRVVAATAGQWRQIQPIGVLLEDVTATNPAKVELLPKKVGASVTIPGQSFQPGFAYYLRNDGIISTKPVIGSTQNRFSNNYLGYAISATELIKNEERFALS